MRKLTRLLALTSSVCAALTFLGDPSPAWADNKKRIAAEALFDQGTELMAKQRYREACAKFEASQALDAGIGTLLYLGDCYERAGRTASAWATFREAESLARASSQGERAQIAAARATALERKLQRLSVVVPVEHRVPGLKIKIAGVEIPPASFGDDLPVDPGEQHVEFSAPGYHTAYTTVQVARNGKGKHRVVVPRLEPLPEERTTTTSSGGTLKTVSIITGGAGIVAVGAGAVLGVVAADKNEESLEHCPTDPEQCSPRGVELREEAGNYADLATASFAAGGGLILTGIVLYIAAPSGQREHGASVAKLEELRVTPAFGGDKLGFSLRGKF